MKKATLKRAQKITRKLKTKKAPAEPTQSLQRVAQSTEQLAQAAARLAERTLPIAQSAAAQSTAGEGDENESGD